MKKYSLVLFFCLIFLSAHLSAQNVTVNNNLTFGTVFPGIPKTISKTTAGLAAEFYVSGTAGNEVTIDFALPTYMNLGASNMQLIFRETDCAIDTSATPDQSSPEFNNLDPWHTLTYRIGSNGLYIWLGGIIVPGLTQTEGSYSSNIVITVTYTGN
ncbi:MAG: hypothetical protein DWP97_03230 [Calditrichaeota bacterium]|nr:MAG: hypothetical protein DWP97_03230 [Calditrichota bacterium]